MKVPLIAWDRPLPQVSVPGTADAGELLMDHEAFAAFYQRTARPLWAYLARVSSNPALADDLLQDTYIHFLGSTTVPDGEVASRRYLFHIATNLLRDHWRRRTLVPLDAVPEPLDVGGHIALPEQLDAETLASHGLAGLRPRERQLLWLAYAEGYTHREIAAITGLAAASIRLLLFRARRKFIRNLRQRSLVGAKL